MNVFLAVLLMAFAIADNDAIRQKSTSDSLTYIAGVVEYHPLNRTGFDMVQRNLEEYLQIISNAAAKNVDILVFPEATLNRDWEFGEWSEYGAVEVPSDEELATPCNEKDKYSRILEELSCAAKNEEMYIVVNVGEKATCPKNSNGKCTEGEKLFFNTNVVFDDNGMIISSYRKINLFGESRFTESLDKKLGMFNTSFGVTFGHFICFDLMFQQPAVQIVEKENIVNIIFPTMWFSELPSLTAVEIQEGWAYTHNVNFLAAGANNPKYGSTGSGIYSGKQGALISSMYGEATTELLVAEIQKNPRSTAKVEIVNNKTKNLPKPDEMDNLFLKTDDMKVYNSEIVNDTLAQQTINLSYGNITCEFNINIKNNKVSNVLEDDFKHYVYRAIAFDGVRSFTFKNGGIVECLIVACTSIDMSSCSTRFKNYSEVRSSFDFTKIEIIANLPKPVFNDTMKAMNSVYYPVTLTTNIMPLQRKDFTYAEEKHADDPERLIVKIVTEEALGELLTFGVFGRVFSNDHLPVTGSALGSNFMLFNFSSFLGILLLPIIFYFMRN